MQQIDRWQWREKREKPAFLALADGSVLRGFSVGAAVDRLGEVVFNTGMSGYQEILTDPSYAGQFVTMTYPEIGNTGVNAADAESRGLFLSGLILHEANTPSNWRSEQSLHDYLVAHEVPGLAGLDTRALTTKLRTAGTQKGYLSVRGEVGAEEAVARARAWEGLDGQDYAARVTCEAPWDFDPDGTMSTSWGHPETLPPADLKVVAYDFGIKYNILRSLRQVGMALTVVPAQTPASEVLARKPDGVFFSNGPADPAGVTYAATAAAELLGKVPIMGICLGCQLLSLGSGATTFRLKFGHHGCNHPVMDLATRAVEITSQNHNFAVATDSLAGTPLELTHVNLNDQTVEGVRHTREPMFAVQYHPEAGPGPHDPYYLFRRFRDLITGA